MIKVAAPKAVCKIADWAIQVHGGAGVSQDYPLLTCTPSYAPCAWQTALTKSTSQRSPRWSFRTKPDG